ncbi:DUF6879 family protein [Nocardia sp. R7R-8]|uniref:DUF6879 family protein n=1 Tax=Nocardia sp. R7R-8 TaxID=3459304 RepID=UPI00403D9DEA
MPPPRQSKVELYAAIRRDSRAGVSGRDLQRKCNVGYQTVRAALRSAWPAERKKYLLALSRHNVAAGEDIRYLVRRDADPSDSATEDFWLFDERAVAFSLFDARGFWVGAALTDEPVIVAHAHAVAIRDRVWSAAIPFEEYANR